MIRKYYIEWHKNEKYSNPVVRHTMITLPSAKGKTEEDAKKATEIFVSITKGGLRKNTILSIKECDENGKQIGDVIKPTYENSIVPMVADGRIAIRN